MRAVLAGLLLVLAAPAASAVNGFVIGLEGQRGSWDADPALLSESGSVPRGSAELFTRPLHGIATSGLNLHLGWNILGWASVEAALQTSFWTPFEKDTRGGVGLAGLRATYFPLQHFLEKDRRFDLGLELGGGYMIAGGPTYGMDGKYVSLGASAEYYPLPWLSLALGYRHFIGMLDTFYFDFEDDVKAEVEGFRSGWGTFFLSVNFHLTTPP